MNLDAVSLALAQISYTIKTLSKNNFKNSLAEISNVKTQTLFLFLLYIYIVIILAHI